MQTPFSAYNQVAPQVYRETSGLYYEDFVVGDTFEHRPGRTITDTDNIWMTLLTMNTQPVHFDANYAAATEWKRLLVDSTLTMAMLTGMSVKTVSAKVVATSAGTRWAPLIRCSPATRFMQRRRCCPSGSRKADPPKASSRCEPPAPTRTV